MCIIIYGHCDTDTTRYLYDYRLQLQIISHYAPLDFSLFPFIVWLYLFIIILYYYTLFIILTIKQLIVLFIQGDK